ncbi:MAG TPA: type IX secretion system sortase PorU [Bacteroidota bacterium]|nr:type IX secretion system sortase PorU [Bacteroidota bacterium]
MIVQRIEIRTGLLACACLFRALQAEAGDVTVLRSDARSVQIEYRAQFREPGVQSSGGTQYMVLGFSGEVRDFRSATAGGPDLRYRYVPLAFPAAAGNALRVIAADYQDIPGALVPPVPLPNRKGKTPSSLLYQADAARYGASRFLPGSVAELAPVGRVRNMLLGGVKIYPVQCNPAQRTVRKYSRIVVEVTFGPAQGLPAARGEDGFLKSVPVNYAAAKTWQGRSPAAVAAPSPSVLASGDWYRLTVNAEGIYRLDASYLSSIGVNVSALDPRTIRIFGNGGRELPEDIIAARPADLVEDAIYVAGESDGKFDAADYVLFYGKGARGWAYDPLGKTLRHYIHDYAEVNYYWLTYGGAQGKRMVVQASLASSPTDVAKSTFTDGIALQEVRTNLLLSSLVGGEGSGRRWFGQQINSGSSFTYVNVLTGLVPTGSIIYRYDLAGQGDNTAAFSVSESGTQIAYAPLGPATGYTVATEGTFQATGTAALAGNTSRLTFAYTGTGTGAAGWIGWYELLYPRSLSAVNDSLRFYAPDTTATVEYHLQGFDATPMIFNVTDHANVRMISGVGGSYIFRAAETGGAPSAYWAAAGSSWRRPVAAAHMPNENIRGYTGGADFIIVTAPQYRSGADRLAAYRSDPAHGGLKVYVADVGQIYDEFGGGVTDVTAIRDFLYFAYQNWTPAPQFVLMLGQASFDYKGILGSQTSIVPTWETPESLDDLGSYGTDDFYGKFSGTDAPSLVIGRISARTAAESDGFVDKLIHYENNSAADSWKMRMLFVGDDSWTPEDGEAGNGTIHSDAAELLSTPQFTPPEFEEEKVYLAEYPTVYTAAGRRKPGAYQAIVNDINQGVLAVNFAGHGNPVQLSNNDVFDIPTSVPQLTNIDRLSVFFLATCNFSEFDDPLNRTGSEVLLNKPDGGAIGVVSADRKVYAGENAALNEGTYQALFTRDAFGRLVVDRPATALFAYKASGGNSPNDQKYSYMGDPTMRFQFPRGYASFDSINGVPTPGGSTVVVNIKSLSKVTVAGSLRTSSNTVDATYNGDVLVTLNDATRLQTILNFYPGAPPWSYLATGGLLYRGVNNVQNGKFTATFVVPKDIQYSDSTSRGRLVAYVYRPDAPAVDAEAFSGNVHIGGTDTSQAAPTTGPVVNIYLGSRSFRPGDLVGESPVLLVDLADSTGINTSTSGVGHRIEAWVNNASQSVDLTNYYTSKPNSFRQGTVQYQLSSLPDGPNSIRVRAWNSYDISGSAEAAFAVASTDQLSVADVFNYPNPFGASGTAFTFRQNQSAPLSVTVKIYTVAGRLIRTLQDYAPGDSFVRVPWDGRDGAGDVIANGVYLYKLIVRTTDGRFTSESLGKLSKVQ